MKDVGVFKTNEGEFGMISARKKLGETTPKQ
jgi:hypothetical protein